MIAKDLIVGRTYSYKNIDDNLFFVLNTVGDIVFGIKQSINHKSYEACIFDDVCDEYIEADFDMEFGDLSNSDIERY